MPMPGCGRLSTINSIRQPLNLCLETVALSSWIRVVAAGLFWMSTLLIR